MSIIQNSVDSEGRVQAQLLGLTYDEKTQAIRNEVSAYNPSEKEREMSQLIIKHFTLGNVTMQTPRIELNDLSVLMRDQIDQLSFNVYQPNNGNGYSGDPSQAWRSRAIRPVVRNKAMSIAAHATARLIFPKIFAQDEHSDEQEDMAIVMSDLMEWAAEQSNYDYYALNRVLQALWSPASIGYTEYAEVYRMVKTERNPDGSWKEEMMLDEDMSGFRDEVVPTDQLYIENFFEPDIQKQGWLILRKVISYDLAKAKYWHLENFKYVTPGVQLIYNDANQSWYQVYDPNMRQYDVEEIVYWNKSLDVKICMVNGVMLSEANNPNPRNDKKYPFDKFGWSIINSRCFYYKSLAFYLQSDASIVNTLYPMIIDGTYLNIMKPMINSGGEVIRSNVFVPGAVTSFSSPDAALKPIDPQGIDLRSGMDTLAKVESSLTESAADTQQPGQNQGSDMTAYQISKIEQNAALVLGLFVKMIGEHVKQFGKLRTSDIIQYLTIPEVSKIEDSNASLVYKSFLMPDKSAASRSKKRKITFDTTLPETAISKDEYLKLSYDTLNAEKGRGHKQSLWRVNPERARAMKYMVTISPDILNPMSEELETAYNLEEYDRMIAAPQVFNPEETGKLLLTSYKKTRKDPEKYLASSSGQNPALAQLGLNAPQPQAQSQPGAQTSPSASALKSQPSAVPTPPVASMLGR